MTCPYFMPTRKSESVMWLRPSRLPLGCGWEGYCTVPGHEGTEPTADELREFCNLGYATGCSRLPAQRPWDAVRFSILRERDVRTLVCYVCEVNHRPSGHGTLEYDTAEGRWTVSHEDPRIQKMAECYLQSYVLRKNAPAEADDIAS